jgi:hypothetical protein
MRLESQLIGLLDAVSHFRDLWRVRRLLDSLAEVSVLFVQGLELG